MIYKLDPLFRQEAIKRGVIMSKLIIGLLLLLPFSCLAREYPAEIVEYGLTKKYDKAKWYLYCLMCDREVKFFKGKSLVDQYTTFGCLPLELDQVNLRGDTVEINMLFKFNGKKLDWRDVAGFPQYWGAVYCGKSDDIVLFSIKSHIRYSISTCPNVKNCPSREVKPLQPEVIKYIKQNRAKLDPWFRQEAIKRGVIK